VRTLIITKIRT